MTPTLSQFPIPSRRTPGFVNENDSVGGVQSSGGEKVAELSGQGSVCVCVQRTGLEARRIKGEVNITMKSDHTAGFHESANIEKYRLLTKDIRDLKLYYTSVMSS